MAGYEATTTSPVGAGRTLSYYHPQTPDGLNGAGTLGKYLGIAVSNEYAWGIQGGGALSTIELVDGACGVKITTAAANQQSGQQGRWTPRPFHRTTKPQGAMPDPHAVTRLGCLLAVDSYAAQLVERNTDDLGPQLVDNLNNGVMGSLGKGFFFGPTSKTTARLRCRSAQNGGETFSDLATVPAGFDSSRWHSYELVLVSATPSAEAQIYGLIDGQLVTPKRKWQTDGLPVPSTQAQWIACVWACLSAWAGGGVIHYGGSWYYTAPTESQL